MVAIRGLNVLKQQCRDRESDLESLTPKPERLL